MNIVLSILVFVLILIFIIAIRRRNISSNKSSIKNIIEKIDRYNSQNPTDYKLEYPIFYINMDKHEERRLHIETQLEKVSDKYHRVPGFNGYLIQNTLNDNIGGVEFENFYKKLKKPEIGCCISHILAIKQAYESGAEIAMICEDDIYLGTYSIIPKLSEVTSKVPENWEILQLYCIFNNSMFNRHQKKYKKFIENDIDKDYIFVKREYPKTAFTTNLAYLINRKGMQKILDKVYGGTDIIHIKPVLNTKNKVYPPKGQADFFLYDLVDNCYAILPNLFFPNNAELESTIHINHTALHLESSATAIKFFDNLLSKKINQLNHNK